MAETMNCYPNLWDNASGHYSYNTSSLYNVFDGDVKGSVNGYDEYNDEVPYYAWQMNTSKNTETYVYAYFDCSSIPENAQIESVTSKIKAYMYSFAGQGSRVTTKTAQFFTGEWGSLIAKSSAMPLAATSSLSVTQDVIFSESDMGVWTREELQTVRLKLYGKVGSTALGTLSANNLVWIGGTIYVEYSVNGIKGYTKIGGTYKELTGGYVNIGGTYKELTGSYKNIGGTWKE